MSNTFFDVQSALLYNEAPQIDAKWLEERLCAQAERHGLPGPIAVLPGLTNAREFAFAGCGVHVMMAVHTQPLQQDAFALQLSAPIRKLKTCDFETIIKTHKQAIVINVGDGELPTPVETRHLMAEMGIGEPADPLIKLTVLHLVIQAIAELQAPLMTDFLPSQSLLSPEELAAVADMGLPVPILFHPYPVDGGKDASGALRLGMMAIHSEHLIGKVMELEAVPEGVDTATMINLMASLIMEHRKGTLPLEHGDVLQESEGLALYIRHEAPAKPGEALRLIASFDTPASGPAPVAEPPAPQPEPAIALQQPASDVAPAPASDPGQSAFQDRIAKLKAKAVPSEEAPHVAQPLPDVSGIDPQPKTKKGYLAAMDFPVSWSTIKIGTAALFFVALYLFNPSAMLESRIAAQMDSQTAFSGAMRGEVHNLANQMSGDAMQTQQSDRPKPVAIQGLTDTDRRILDVIQSRTAPTDERPTPTEKPKGQFIVAGTDADGNRIIYRRELSDDTDREQIMQEVLTGTLRSELIKAAE